MAMLKAAVQVVGPMAVEIAVEMAAANSSEAHKKTRDDLAFFIGLI